MTIGNFLRQLNPFGGSGGGGRDRDRRDRHDDDDPDATRTLDPREEKRRLENSYAPAPTRPSMDYSSPHPETPSAPPPDISPPHHPSNRRFMNQPWRQRTPEEMRDMRSKAKKCCKRSVRYLFFAFNIVLLVFGGGLLGAAVWIRGQTAEFFEVERGESDMVVLLETAFECMLGVGCTFFAIALWGIISECARQPHCLVVYIVALIVFLLCQLITAETFIITARKSDDGWKIWMKKKRTNKEKKEKRKWEERKKERMEERE